MLLFLVLPLTLSGCGTCPTQPPATSVDYSLLRPIDFPPRPSDPVTNGDLLEVIEELKLLIEADNERKDELRKQILDLSR